MTTNGARSAFQSMGDAQLLAAQGNQQIARLIADAVVHAFRSILGRFHRNRTGRQSFV